MQFKPDQKPKKDDIKQATNMLNQDPSNPVSLFPKNEDVSKLTAEEIQTKYPERFKAFVEMLKQIQRGWGDLDETLELKLWIQALNNLENYISEHNEGNGVLRERQATVFDDLRKFIEAGKKRGKVILPTGVGKTVLFTEFTKALDLPTLIVVPTQILVNQTGDKIDQFAPNMEYGKVYADAKQHGRPVTIITYDSLVSGLKSGTIKPEDYKALILDEAHESLTVARQQAISQFENKSVILEFTATDKYSESKKLTSETIHELSIKEAVEENLLSPLSCIIAKTKVDLSKVKISGSGDYDPKQFEEEIKRRGVNKACVEMYEQGFNGKQAIVFSASISHGNEVKREFNKKFGKGFAECLNGEQTPNEQKDVIERYRKGEIKVLIGVDLLTRGFDAPEASVCLNLAPTFSVVRATQRGGRVLRIDETNLAKHAVIIDFLYEDDRKGKKPILFAEVVGQAVVVPKGKKEKKKEKKESKDGGGGGSDNVDGEGDVIKIEGIEVVTDSDEVIKITNSLKEKSQKLTEQGWMTAYSMRLKFGGAERIFSDKAEKYRPTNPEWFAKEKLANGMVAEVFHPELVELIKSREVDYGGWLTANGIKDKIGGRHEAYKRKAEEYRKDHPEWFKVIPGTGGTKPEYYHPDLVAILTLRPPENWWNPSQLNMTYGGRYDKYKALAEAYRTSNPGWFKKYDYRGKEGVEFYHPDLVKLLLKEMGKEM